MNTFIRTIMSAILAKTPRHLATLVRRLVGVLLAMTLLATCFHGQAWAVTTGIVDGTYDFGQLGPADSGGTGFMQLGDKFKVGNDQFGQYPSHNTGLMTALYLNTPATTAQTAVIKAEGGSTCKTFTFKDLGISAYRVRPATRSPSARWILSSRTKTMPRSAPPSLWGHPGRLPPIR